MSASIDYQNHGFWYCSWGIDIWHAYNDKWNYNLLL